MKNELIFSSLPFRFRVPKRVPEFHASIDFVARSCEGSCSYCGRCGRMQVAYCRASILDDEGCRVPWQTVGRFLFTHLPHGRTFCADDLPALLKAIEEGIAAVQCLELTRCAA